MILRRIVSLFKSYEVINCNKQGKNSSAVFELLVLQTHYLNDVAGRVICEEHTGTILFKTKAASLYTL
jgi:hypothetical protein